MDIQSEKLLLIEQLLRVSDVRIMEQIRELLNKESNPIVGFDPQGRPVTHLDFIRKVEAAEFEFEQGDFQSVEEVEKESESW